MRTPLPNLLDVLFGAYRQRALALLLLHPQESFHVREIARRTGIPPGSLHRELKLLADSDILLHETLANQVRYRANTALPVFDELSRLFHKTAGTTDAIRQSLMALDDAITLAFIFGSFARREERSRSDLDLFLLGTASFVDVVKALAPAALDLGREINPVVMTAAVFREKIAAGDSFLKRILSERKVFVKGSDDDLGKLAENPPPRRPRARRG